MRKQLWWYIGFFVILLAGFFYFTLRDQDFSKSPLAVINPDIQNFSFINQNSRTITEKDVEGKVYVAAFFFTTCKGICPRMNANMRRVFDAYKDEPGFMILSHTCMPETDSIPLLKKYERMMINGTLIRSQDGSYHIDHDPNDTSAIDATANPNWDFVTGNKTDLYKMARQSYLIDNNKPDSAQNIADQFIHTQFFALVDKQRRLRGIYDGLRGYEVEKLIEDIKELLKEKVDHKHFMNGFSNTPN